MTDESNILTKDTVANYVTEHASQIKVFPADANLTADAIQGGNVNFAFCVRRMLLLLLYYDDIHYYFTYY